MSRKGANKKPRAVDQVIGPLGDPGSLYFQLRQFLQHLRERGYSERTVENREGLLIAFIRWCDERGLTRPQDITRPILERYQRHLFLHRKANG
ncbi:phage integrase N-terminal SAM-like domain-containing protein, partial [Pseudomonas fluorescens]|uniref:phage integrase N-terminal SAM-like domain-containing protein n=1 Tax=Pseudomonas fluorescens TaxID=294 RepID=UPI001783B573